VRGIDDVYAAGAGTAYPVKQKGRACQLADVIAEQLAAAGGADIEPQPFRPVLRGRLLTGRGAQYLEHPPQTAPGTDPTPELQLWSAPHKLDGRYLSPWLEELDGPAPAPAITEPDHVDIEVELPSASTDAMRLDPYSPPAD
jgi:sulfide:quinone oxidoreductase